MPSSDVTVPTSDGECAASLHVPAGDGPWPAVILYPDAGGVRQTFVDMGARLSTLGYVVLVPDIYYRSGGYEPFDMNTVFTDPDERSRLGALVMGLPPELARRDAESFHAYLTALDEVGDGPIGTTGYCFGGYLSLTAATHLGAKVGAAASFHGGRLAMEDDPDSPSLGAANVSATIYVGAARDDGSFDAAQAERLDAAYRDAGVAHTIETYDALHGFAVPDNPTYDEAAAEQHWSAMATLYADALGA